MINKFFVILFLLLIMPVYAADWVELYPKSYMDLSSIDENGNIKSAWFKELNPGDWELAQNKKVWYVLAKYEFNCSKRKINLLQYASYDLKGHVIYTNDNMYNWASVVPDSVGEYKYKMLCVD